MNFSGVKIILKGKEQIAQHTKVPRLYQWTVSAKRTEERYNGRLLEVVASHYVGRGILLIPRRTRHQRSVLGHLGDPKEGTCLPP
jgi:hypothetical protein